MGQIFFLKNLISKRYSNVFYELSKRLPHFILTISKRFKNLKLRGREREDLDLKKGKFFGPKEKSLLIRPIDNFLV